MKNRLFPTWDETNLPIFHQQLREGHLLYAPGYLLFTKSLSPVGKAEMDSWNTLFTTAKEKSRQKDAILSFHPVSLHIYLTTNCNLSCEYCFSTLDQQNAQAQFISISAIEAAVHLVANNCKAAGLTMTVALHGGGEPTQDPRIEEIIKRIKEICSEESVHCFFYLATNGVFAEQKAEWICQTFDLVGLSCDGPPEIQNQQRKMKNGGENSLYLERTANIFRERKQPFEVRVTVTGSTWKTLPRIAEYIVETLQPEAINIELVYLAGSAPLEVDEIGAYVDLYCQAKAYSERRGIAWRTSTIRPDQRHQRYCHVFHDTLQIMPDGSASVCFLDSVRQQSEARGSYSGYYSQDADAWILDEEISAAQAVKLNATYEECERCFLQYHCSRDCPNQCPLTQTAFQTGIFCQLHQHLFSRLLLDYGKTLAEQSEAKQVSAIGMAVESC